MIVGIDLGATKTHVIAERDRDIVDEFVTSTIDLLGELPVDHQASVFGLVRLLSRIDGIVGSTIVIGAHGLDSAEQCRNYTKRLQRVYGAPVLAVNDAELLGPAGGLRDAIAVVVGTGSKLIARNAAGETISAGGFGHLFSDAGSAGGLVREATRAILDWCDAGHSPEALGSLFMDRLGVSDEVELAQRLSVDSRLATWAELAPLIFDAISAGSELGLNVVNEAAKALAKNVADLVRRGAVGSDVVCAGGVISRQPLLFGAFQASVNDFELGLKVSLLATDPVRGALELGRQMTAATGEESLMSGIDRTR